MAKVYPELAGHEPLHYPGLGPSYQLHYSPSYSPDPLGDIGYQTSFTEDDPIIAGGDVADLNAVQYGESEGLVNYSAGVPSSIAGAIYRAGAADQLSLQAVQAEQDTVSTNTENAVRIAIVIAAGLLIYRLFKRK